MLFQREGQTTHEHIRTIEELVSNDRGGMIISPQQVCMKTSLY